MKKFADYMISMLNSIIRAMSSMLGQMIVGGIIGGFKGPSSAPTRTASPSATLHSGGRVGFTQTHKKYVDPSIFNFAPRLHNGLRRGEYPAILEVGEEVIPKGKSSGGVEVNVINNTSPVEVTETRQRFDGRKMILDVVIDAIHTKPGFRSAIRGA